MDWKILVFLIVFGIATIDQLNTLLSMVRNYQSIADWNVPEILSFEMNIRI